MLTKICLFLPIDKIPEVWYNWAARFRALRAEFTIIPHPTEFVNRKIAQIVKKFFSRFCALC
jgi:hypothetical protein